MQAHEELQQYKADCERRLQLAEAKAAEAKVSSVHQCPACMFGRES